MLRLSFKAFVPPPKNSLPLCETCFAAVTEFDVFHFVVVFCCCFAQGLTQSPVWPSDKQLSEAARRAERGVGENGGFESLCMCVHMLGV